MDTPVDPFQTGIFKGLPFDQYLNLSGLSNSALNELNRSPAHFQYYIKHGKDSSDAMELGKIIHTVILEPDELTNRFIVGPTHYKEEKLNRTKKDHKAYWSDFVAMAAAQKKEIVEGKDFLKAQKIMHNLQRHSTIPALLVAVDAEVSFQWTKDNLHFKGRTDALLRNLNIAVDIKTTKNARMKAFEKTIFYSGYHRQGAQYIEGLETLGKKLDHYIIIAIETEEPFLCATYRLLPEIIEQGKKERQKLIDRYNECREKGEWPGYPEHIQDIALPSWVIETLDEEFYE